MEYFATLKIGKLTYNDFVISAVAYIINNSVKFNKLDSLGSFVEKLARLFIHNSELAKAIFNFLVEIKIGEYYVRLIYERFFNFLIFFYKKKYKKDVLLTKKFSAKL